MTATEKQRKIDYIKSMTVDNMAVIYGCDKSQVVNQLKSNLKQLRNDYVKACITNDKVRGATKEDIKRCIDLTVFKITCATA